MARKVFLDYCWHLLSCQLGYAFSSPHTVAYSIEAVQEANLATRFSPLFWQCACLSVNAGSSMTTMETDFGEEDSSDPSSDKTATADYGKIARAIVQARNAGVNIELPDINKAESDFVPDVENNAIIFSLQSVSGVNADLVNRIVECRPYSSLEDFISKVEPSRQQMFALLKAGSFDKLYPGKTRGYIVVQYLHMLAADTVQMRKGLTMANVPLIESLGLFPEELSVPQRVVRFKKWEDANEYNKEDKRYLIQHPSAVLFFENYFKPLIEVTDCNTTPNGYSVTQKVFNKVAAHYTNQIKSFLGDSELIKKVYEGEQEAFVQDLFDKYFAGTVSRWEIDTLHFYHSTHELASVNEGRYGLVDFDSLPEEPIPVGYSVGKDGKEHPVFAIHQICGTVLNADNNKHIVTLLTHNNKIVDIKFYREMYNNYNKTISENNEQGKKTVVDGSWFAKGNLLLVSGFRRENSFIPRVDWRKGARSSVCRICGISHSGELTLMTKRKETA